MIRNWIVYTDGASPDVGADQLTAILIEVIDDAARPVGWPGATVAELPALIEAKTVVPFE